MPMTEETHQISPSSPNSSKFDSSDEYTSSQLGRLRLSPAVQHELHSLLLGAELGWRQICGGHRV